MWQQDHTQGAQPRWGLQEEGVSSRFLASSSPIHYSSDGEDSLFIQLGGFIIYLIERFIIHLLFIQGNWEDSLFIFTGKIDYAFDWKMRHNPLIASPLAQWSACLPRVLLTR